MKYMRIFYTLGKIFFLSWIPCLNHPEHGLYKNTKNWKLYKYKYTTIPNHKKKRTNYILTYKSGFYTHVSLYVRTKEHLKKILSLF